MNVFQMMTTLGNVTNIKRKKPDQLLDEYSYLTLDIDDYLVIADDEYLVI